MTDRAAAGSEPATFYRARRLFVGGVAFVFALAFGELFVQLPGLFGARGIAPLAPALDRLAGYYRGWSRLQLPTLLWFGASDVVMQVLAGVGLGSAVAAVFGVLPRWLLLLSWLLYLSFVCVGEPFLSFQWDALLLEAGLLAVLWAPGGLVPFRGSEAEPSRVGRWLVHWLLFRLLLLSGLLKLASGDVSWRDGTALDFHFWTQPLPNRLSHWAHWLPPWCHALAVWTMFAIELGVPLLLLVPRVHRRCRQVAAAATVLLMAGIFATGNYGFFNLLTAVLCVPLLDDRAFAALLRRPPREREPRAAPRWHRVPLAVFAAIVLAATTHRALQSFRALPASLAMLAAVLAPAADLTSPFQCCNGYGLFRVMTRERPELLLEGSDDGEHWRSYGFRYKPLELDRAPVFAGLYMPRLDWQLWFAALGGRLDRYSAWTLGLLRGVLEGSPDVLGLLGHDPFAGRPPALVRLRVAQYRFSTTAQRAAGIWWQRDEPEPYSGVWKLEHGELVRAR
ncbi:MAG TPA: lipase maturation factor family protein [Planctomycetota bacterium]|nr:lipase maturation factor family protein [Planctomycetota bacterium]